MKISAYALATETFLPVLRTLSQILDKGVEYANAKKFDSAVLANARLAPDMYPLFRQVKLACFQADASMARLIGKDFPRPDEQAGATFEAMKAQIEKTIEHVRGIPEAALEGVEERDICLPLRDDLVLEMKGLPYVRDWALPHFYFHVVSAYNILRHNGVEIGKQDYMSHVGSSIRHRPTQQG